MEQKRKILRKVMIKTTMAAIIASQLMLVGCSSKDPNEYANLADDDAIVTIVDLEQNTSKMTQTEPEWAVLASRTTYGTKRNKIDNVLYVTPFGNGGKNGVLYINLDGTQTNDNTLRNALYNKQLNEKLSDRDTILELKEVLQQIYSDASSSDSQAKTKNMFINAYYNLFSDGTDGTSSYYEADRTITRKEFFSALYKSNTTYADSTGVTDFAKEYGEKYSYINYDKFTDEELSQGITVAEAVYAYVSMVYPDELASVDTTQKKIDTYSDCTLSKEIVDSTESIRKYCLNDSISKGEMAPELYKAMVVAKAHNLLGSDATYSTWASYIDKDTALTIIGSNPDKFLYSETLGTASAESNVITEANSGETTITDITDAQVERLRQQDEKYLLYDESEDGTWSLKEDIDTIWTMTTSTTDMLQELEEVYGSKDNAMNAFLHWIYVEDSQIRKNEYTEEKDGKYYWFGAEIDTSKATRLILNPEVNSDLGKSEQELSKDYNFIGYMDLDATTKRLCIGGVTDELVEQVGLDADYIFSDPKESYASIIDNTYTQYEGVETSEDAELKFNKDIYYSLCEFADALKSQDTSCNSVYDDVIDDECNKIDTELAKQQSTTSQQSTTTSQTQQSTTTSQTQQSTTTQNTQTTKSGSVSDAVATQLQQQVVAYAATNYSSCNQYSKYLGNGIQTLNQAGATVTQLSDGRYKITDDGNLSTVELGMYIKAGIVTIDNGGQYDKQIINNMEDLINATGNHGAFPGQLQ